MALTPNQKRALKSSLLPSGDTKASGLGRVYSKNTQKGNPRAGKSYRTVVRNGVKWHVYDDPSIKPVALKGKPVATRAGVFDSVG